MSTLAPEPLIARVEREIVQAFRGRSALSGATAQKLRDLGIKDTQVLRGMVSATIVRKAGPDRYFLHEPTWATRGHVSWRTAGLIGIGVVTLAAVAYLLLR
jgi:hypothetical protein